MRRCSVNSAAVWSSPALDPRWVAERLVGEPRAPGASGTHHRGAPDTEPVLVLDARLRADRLTVLYRMQGRAGAELWVGHVIPRGSTPDELAAGANGLTRVLAMPSADLLLVPYPHDPALRIPSAATIGAWCKAHPSRLAPDLASGVTPLRQCTVEPLRYVPGKRWTARVSIAVPSPAGHTRRIALIAKHYASRERAVRAHRTLAALAKAAHGADAPTHFRVPHAIGLDRAKALVYSEALRGVSLEQALPVSDLAPCLERLGRALAHLHALPVDTGRSVAATDVRGRARAALRLVARVFPDCAEQTRTLRVALDGAAIERGRPRALLHGSFRLNHVLIDRDAFGLVDLDGAAMGDPAYDVANLLSSLDYLVAESRLDPRRRRTIARAFLAGYRAAAPGALSERAIAWYLAALTIEKQALKYATRPRDAAGRKARHMLELAAGSLARHAALHPSRGARPSARRGGLA
jgi:aminoglycoside phosphotransferase (APT) family kinase protein